MSSVHVRFAESVRSQPGLVSAFLIDANWFALGTALRTAGGQLAA